MEYGNLKKIIIGDVELPTEGASSVSYQVVGDVTKIEIYYETSESKISKEIADLKHMVAKGLSRRIVSEEEGYSEIKKNPIPRRED